MNGPEMHCDPNAYCLLIPETSDFKCECKPGYNGTGKVCSDVCAGFCENKGTCVKDSRGQPSCRCVGSFIGPHCEDKSEFAYIAGGIAATVIFLIIIALFVWMICARSEQRKEPKKLVAQTQDHTGSQVNFYYGAAPYAESIAPSHHSTYAHYYDDEEDGWEMPNFYNETYMKESLHNGKMNSLARSNASIYGNKEELYDRLKRHAYPGKKDKSDSESEGQ
uniref:EGF-like domain-containing protein n=2 Tax=Graphocephala atropunctata TaxID=36148 RepID=A0A1B6L5Q2_9HEMI